MNKIVLDAPRSKRFNLDVQLDIFCQEFEWTRLETLMDFLLILSGPQMVFMAWGINNWMLG